MAILYIAGALGMLILITIFNLRRPHLAPGWKIGGVALSVLGLAEAALWVTTRRTLLSRLQRAPRTLTLDQSASRLFWEIGFFQVMGVMTLVLNPWRSHFVWWFGAATYLAAGIEAGFEMFGRDGPIFRLQRWISSLRSRPEHGEE